MFFQKRLDTYGTLRHITENDTVRYKIIRGLNSNNFKRGTEMADKKVAKKKETSVKKTVKKVEPKLYVTRTLKKTTENIKNKVDGYSETYLKKPLKAGQGFVSEFKDEPKKTLDTAIEDTNKFLKDFKTDSRKKYNSFIEDKKAFVQKVTKSPVKSISEIAKDVKKESLEKVDTYKKNGSEIVEGVKSDLSIIIDDIVENGKNQIEKIPMKKTIEEKIDSGLKSIPSRLNLPGKNEIDKIMQDINGVNKKVDELKEYASA